MDGFKMFLALVDLASKFYMPHVCMQLYISHKNIANWDNLNQFECNMGVFPKKCMPNIDKTSHLTLPILLHYSFSVK